MKSQAGTAASTQRRHEVFGLDAALAMAAIEAISDPDRALAAPPLAREFYLRPAAEVARALLGTTLVHQLDGHTLAGRIVETEAYLATGDLAAHSARGLTPRTRVIFGPPGHAYVYLSYGVHHCLNFVAEAEGVPGCVLIRALEPLVGIDEMKRRRKRARGVFDYASGPGKLTQAMGVTLDHYGADVTGGALEVRRAPRPDGFRIAVTTRIGISVCQELPLRFHIADNEYVSAP